jgi:predicted CoA-binding protein
MKQSGARDCLALLWIDGLLKTDYDELSMIPPSDIAVVEVYARSSIVPTQFVRPTSECGAVVVWTKRMFSPTN